MSSGAPLISVALCTHNHLDRLKKTLAAIEWLEGPSEGWELLVVDNASTDGTAEYLAAHGWQPHNAPARVVHEPRLGLSNARNCAIEAAEGDYILFIDDDETPHEHWLINHAKAILRCRPDALGGPIDVQFVDGARPSWLQDELLGFIGRLDHGGEERWLTSPETPIFGGNFAFRRQVFSRIGQFADHLGRRGRVNFGGEDIEIYERLLAVGAKVLWTPRALIYHRIEATKMRRRYFLDLHYRLGLCTGAQRRGSLGRTPPRYVLLQCMRAATRAAAKRLKDGADHSLRSEMNVAYFLGFIAGWARG